jgi:hypothetical protein
VTKVVSVLPDRVENAVVMSELAINPQVLRMRQLVWPREHGAWGILVIPLITGAVIGLGRAESIWPVILFASASLAVFCLRTPVESLLGNAPMRAQTDSERASVTKYALCFAAIAALSLSMLLWGGRHPALLLIGTIAGVSFALQILVCRLGRGGRTAAQLIGALGLTSTSAGACYVLTGQFDTLAVALWLVNWMFVANQIHFVQIRIHGARLSTAREKLLHGWLFLCGQAVTLAALVVFWRSELLPGLALFAFLPVLVRGALWFVRGTRPLQVRRLGMSELVHAVVFGVLLIAGFIA